MSSATTASSRRPAFNQPPRCRRRRRLPVRLLGTAVVAVVIFATTAGSAAVAADGTTVLRGARLIDGSGAAATGPVDIVVRQGQIVSVGPISAENVTTGVKVADYRGKTIIPGLICTHAHLGQTDDLQRGPQNFTRANIVRQLKQYQAYGVTTLMSLGTNLPLIYDLRQQAAAEPPGSRLPGADFRHADIGIGAVMGAPGAMLRGDVDQIERPQTAQAGREAVQRAHQRGTEAIKMWVDSRNANVIPLEVIAAVIDEAHRLDLQVLAHVFSLADAKAVVQSGVDVVAHGIRDQPVDQPLIDAMKAGGTWYVPTLTLEEVSYVMADRLPWYDEPWFRNSLQPRLAAQVTSDAWREEILASPATATARNSVEMNLRNLAILHAAGVAIGFGTDSGAFPLRVPGFAEHRELELMCAAGLTPLEVITIATSRSAQLLQLDDRGLVQAGKRADLVVLEADPSDDIRQVHQIHAVWQAGQPVAGRLADFQPLAVRELRRDRAEEAFQAVAVDADAWFAINNRTIGRYDQASGQRTHSWTAPADSPVKHMNSGRVYQGRLYCANSNWPQAPLENTIEVLDANNLQHLQRLTFDESAGAINWVDRHADAWWVAFAFYGPDQVRKTYLQRFDDHWQPTGKWTFPEAVIQRFLPNSNSGGGFGPDGKLYVTGHDHAELYVLQLPTSPAPGSQAGDTPVAGTSGTLQYLTTLEAPIAGQGIAWDHWTSTAPPASTARLFGLVRKTRDVVQMSVPLTP